MLEFLNLIPLGLLAYWVFVSYTASRQRDQMDTYFQVNKRHTGKRFRNIFGIPTADL